LLRLAGTSGSFYPILCHVLNTLQCSTHLAVFFERKVLLSSLNGRHSTVSRTGTSFLPSGVSWGQLSSELELITLLTLRQEEDGDEDERDGDTDSDLVRHFTRETEGKR
jgi:hypothetical protein